MFSPILIIDEEKNNSNEWRSELKKNNNVNLNKK